MVIDDMRAAPGEWVAEFVLDDIRYGGRLLGVSPRRPARVPVACLREAAMRRARVGLPLTPSVVARLGKQLAVDGWRVRPIRPALRVVVAAVRRLRG